MNSGGGDGAEVIYALRNDDTLSRLISQELQKEGQNIRRVYQRRLPNDPTKDYYYMLRLTPNTEAIIVEYGFLDSKSDDVDQLKNNYEKYAEAVVRALVDYIGATYIPVASSDYYIVSKNDTLWSIAKKLNTTVEDLKKINNLNSNNLSIGQVLQIPGSNKDAISRYVVKKGDTLYNIARKYNVTIQDLISLNNLKSTNLSVGQVLKINNEPLYEDDNYYIVSKGDTLYAIANKYNVSVQDLIDKNNLFNNSLSVGQKLLIPTTDNNTKLYTVVSKDTLYKIANDFNVSVDSLKKENNLNANTLSIGQILKIPSNRDYVTYTVQENDNLYQIAQKYNTTISDIETINNLDTSNLMVGQKILIPTK